MMLSSTIILLGKFQPKATQRNLGSTIIKLKYYETDRIT